MPQKEFSFEQLNEADLQVDALYKAGTKGNISDDPLSKLMGCENQGGFRKIGKVSTSDYKLAILYSLMDDPDWPDSLDIEQGVFVYYGDNKEPGHELHETRKGGNRLLKFCFDALSIPNQRRKVPPFFIFTRGLKGRDVIFRGLAAPGSDRVKPTEELVALWKSKGNKRFQNYQAYFTILNVPIVKKAWVRDLFEGNPLSENCPAAWRNWVEKGVYDTLRVTPTKNFRDKNEQLPTDEMGIRILNQIYEYFKDNPFGFQYCAAKLAFMMDKNVTSCDVTKLWRDGGRDAVGLYRIGTKGDSIDVEFALEAKCFKPEMGVGVKHTSRLISRLKNRQFGIFITTSYIGLQPYQEIREDEHPVIIVSGADIASLLVNAGIRTKEEVTKWLLANFPKG